MTAILGDNFVGKTAICEWVSALESRQRLARWKLRSDSLPIIYTITSREHNNTTKVRVKIDVDRVTYYQGGHELPEPVSRCRFIFVQGASIDWDEVDDLGALALMLGMEREVIKEYLPKVGRSIYCTVEKIETQIDEDDKVTIFVTMDGTIPGVPMRLISHSETGRIVLELALAIAQYISMSTKVVLVVERAFSSFDSRNMQRYVDWVINQEFKFQTIFISYPDADDVDWSKCHIVNLTGERHNVHVVE